MSKTRNKQHKQSDHYLGEIRLLKSQLRQARKRIRDLEKYADLYTSVVEEFTEDEVRKETEKENSKCPKCKQDSLKVLDLNFVKFVVCDNCKNHREKIK